MSILIRALAKKISNDVELSMHACCMLFLHVSHSHEAFNMIL